MFNVLNVQIAFTLHCNQACLSLLAALWPALAAADRIYQEQTRHQLLTIINLINKDQLSSTRSTPSRASTWSDPWPQGSLCKGIRFCEQKYAKKNDKKGDFCSLLVAWLSLNIILYTSWVALYSVVCEWVSEMWGISNTQPNLHFFQYIQA